MPRGLKIGMCVAGPCAALALTGTVFAAKPNTPKEGAGLTRLSVKSGRKHKAPRDKKRSATAKSVGRTLSLAKGEIKRLGIRIAASGGRVTQDLEGRFRRLLRRVLRSKRRLILQLGKVGGPRPLPKPSAIDLLGTPWSELFGAGKGASPKGDSSDRRRPSSEPPG